MSDTMRLSAPSAARNRGPILQAILPHLPRTGLVLEIASGTGEHVAYFAAENPGLTWQPTDPDADRQASIDAWTSDLPNVRPAATLDASSADWPFSHADAILCINMIHISPWSATVGLIIGAARLLPTGGILALYGAYRRRNVPLEPGNQEFDADLKRRDPAWGLRELETVADLAAQSGFGPPLVVDMPSNNLTVIFHRN